MSSKCIPAVFVSGRLRRCLTPDMSGREFVFRCVRAVFDSGQLSSRRICAVFISECVRVVFMSRREFVSARVWTGVCLQTCLSSVFHWTAWLWARLGGVCVQAVFLSGQEFVARRVWVVFVSGQHLILDCLYLRTCPGDVCIWVLFIVCPVENGFQTSFCFHLHCYAMQKHFDETVLYES